MFLGQARRSVGDVTFYVSNGQQRSRVRRRVIKNPRSLAQQAQRAALSNVSQLYAAGREIFDHAFEGYSTPAANQKRFLKLNVNRLKGLIIEDFENEPSEHRARIGARGLSVPVPFVGLQVSDGSYAQSLFTYSPEDFGFFLPTVTASEKVSEYAKRVGLIPGDIYTFVVFSVRKSAGELATFWKQQGGAPIPPPDYVKLFGCEFGYAQIKVKDTVLSDETAIDGGSFSLLFDNFGGVNLDSIETGVDYIAGNQIVGGTDNISGGIACIRSKYGANLRSTSYLMPTKSASGFAEGMDYGLTAFSIDLAWQDPATDSSEDQILSGENF